VSIFIASKEEEKKRDRRFFPIPAEMKRGGERWIAGNTGSLICLMQGGKRKANRLGQRLIGVAERGKPRWSHAGGGRGQGCTGASLFELLGKEKNGGMRNTRNRRTLRFAATQKTGPITWGKMNGR